MQLLQSEDQAKILESEKKRILDYLNRINELIKQQKDVQGRTGGGGDMKALSGEQRGLAGKTGQTRQDMKATEPQRRTTKGRRQRKEQGDRQGKVRKARVKARERGEGDRQRGEARARARERAKARAKGDGKGRGQRRKAKARARAKGEGKGEGGEGSEASPSDQDQDQNPARKAIEDARKEMEKAAAGTRQGQARRGVKEQEDSHRAIGGSQGQAGRDSPPTAGRRDRAAAGDADARFEKMLQMQLVVNQGTVLLDKVPKPQRTYNHQIESSRLSTKENDIIVEVDKALVLLKEDGTAVAMPEAVRQMREDMVQVVHRLAQARAEEITQTIEKDIIAALQEIIDALKKEQKEQSDKQKPSRPGPSGEPPTPPLIDTLAELKMIRALQIRVNTRTERYRKLIVGEQAEQADLVDALQRLGEQQQRIFRITRDLDMGKNQ